MKQDQGSSRDLSLTASGEGPTLSDVLHALYAEEIGCGLESFWDEGWTVFIGDRMNGRYREALFSNDDFSAIPQWLLTNVDELIGEWKTGRDALEARSRFRLLVFPVSESTEAQPANGLNKENLTP